MTFNSQLKQVAPIVNQPNVDQPNVDQSIGEWRKNGVCFVGARLAHALNAGTLYYLDGAEGFAKAIGAHLILIVMLGASGSGWDPFDAEPWPIPVSTVWHALQTEEHLRDLRHASLSCVSPDYPDLSHAVLNFAQLKGRPVHRVAGPR